MVEQLLINYANESLQRHFNRHLFEIEQDLYTSEGVDWTFVEFKDNKPCLDLFEAPVGIISTLDDSWSVSKNTLAPKIPLGLPQIGRQNPHHLRETSGAPPFRICADHLGAVLPLA